MAIGSNMLSHLIHDLSFALNLFACSDLLDSNISSVLMNMLLICLCVYICWICFPDTLNSGIKLLYLLKSLYF
jgi:hypothetical protein